MKFKLDENLGRHEPHTDTGRSLDRTISEASYTNHSGSPGAAKDEAAFAELDDVTLTKPVFVDALGRELPAGSHGTVVGIWQGGRAYEVEFTRPFECLVTVLPEGLAA